MQKLLSIRTGNERGRAFLDALRSIVESDPQKPNQTDVIMRLVFDEAARVRKRTLPNKKTIAAMKESRTGRPRAKSVKDLWKALDAEGD